MIIIIIGHILSRFFMLLTTDHPLLFDEFQKVYGEIGRAHV